MGGAGHKGVFLCVGDFRRGNGMGGGNPAFIKNVTKILKFCKEVAFGVFSCVFNNTVTWSCSRILEVNVALYRGRQVQKSQ